MILKCLNSSQCLCYENASARLTPYASEILPWTNDEDGVARQLEKLF